jgi:hypothetical protein
MVSIGLRDAGSGPVPTAILSLYALLFVFVLQRCLRANGKEFATRVFETRRFFESGV